MQETTAIERLLHFAQARGLLCGRDVCYARNLLLHALRMEAPQADAPMDDAPLGPTATPMLEALEGAAIRRGIIPDQPFFREQFSAHLMNLLTPMPSQVDAAFAARRDSDGIVAATDWFYALCQANDYIRVDQIARNEAYAAPSPYGDLEITINLSKPEKDPKEIALLKDAKPIGYPLCMLCVENEGYAGHLGYPTHETLRTIPVTLRGGAWRFQYSPYSYYPEHCIVLNERHVPMAVSRRTFDLLLAFVDQFPHYFIGSNADLPIVGGSILGHDHFQGGRHVFPMDKATPYAAFAHPAYPEVQIEAVSWPMTCLRLTGDSPEELAALSEAILAAWRTYDDPENGVLHATDGTPHNTITPIARKVGNGLYMLQLVLRNNRTSGEHPLGIFHPHADLHHIKRENIGLIEVMGLFILPGRLKAELGGLTAFLTGKRALIQPDDTDPLAKHYDWIEAIVGMNGTDYTVDEAEAIIRKALAEKCRRVLEDAGVFKLTGAGKQGLSAFLQSVGIMPVTA